MKIIAIICEYNIFHNGHKSQLELIRSAHGDDCAVVAIMSGNFVQRGEAAVMPKHERARLAVRQGVDLVLELPFPWSCSGAEYFARSAVWIAHSLGVADLLCFGSETGDLEKLNEYRENLTSCRYKKALDLEFSESIHTPESGIKLRQRIYSGLFGSEYPIKPNDILAVEYLKALDSFGSSVTPFTHKRTGGFSATAARKSFAEGDFDKLAQLVPPTAHDACIKQKAPALMKNAESAILFGLRSAEASKDIAECGGGGAAYLKKAALESATLEDFFENAATKKYTSAKIRRMAVNTLLSVSPEDVSVLPKFTLLLAASKKGCGILARIKKNKNNFPIVTRPADAKRLSGEARSQYELSKRADTVLYPLTLPFPSLPRQQLATTPYIESGL